MQGRFKDDAAPAGGTLNPGASQGEVNTIIESYNQQMRTFKDSVNGVNRAVARPGGGLVNDNTYSV